MLKKVAHIDEEKCIGCGLCANTCAQSVIEIIDGKAKMTGISSCDGLGNCLPVCPVNAISFVEQEINNINSEVGENKSCVQAKLNNFSLAPMKSVEKTANSNSMLKQWPVQIKLVPAKAHFLNNADILIAADCTAYAYANFHADFMQDKITLIGCPKLDQADYSSKFVEIFKNNVIKSITLVKMEVPCCQGLLVALQNALASQEEFNKIPMKIITISTAGEVLSF